MMKRIELGWTILGVALSAAGCVSPGRYDPTALVRYQKVMVPRSPQQRAGEEGLDSLRPLPPSAGPKIEIITDKKTGRSSVQLSLNEAIMLALANSLDIRAVSYDPAIAREEVVKAAAEFDYVLFGGVSRSKTKQQISSNGRTTTSFSASETDVRTHQLGLRQKVVTGAQWSVTGDMTRSWDNSQYASRRAFGARWEPTMLSGNAAITAITASTSGRGEKWKRNSTTCT